MQRVNCLKCITTISLYLWIPVTRIRKYVNTLNTKNDRVKTVLQGFNLSSLFTFEWCNSGAVTKVPPPFVNTNQWRADQGVNTHDCLYQVTCENILLSERVLGTRQLIKHKMSKMQPHKLFKFFFAFFFFLLLIKHNGPKWSCNPCIFVLLPFILLLISMTSGKMETRHNFLTSILEW